MEKIIQIMSNEDVLYCLTSDGKVYVRAIIDREKKQVTGRNEFYFTGKEVWEEIKPIETF